jgi:hypothetical protein
MAQKGQHEAPHGDPDPAMPLQSPESRKPQLNPTVCGCHCGRANSSFGGNGGGDGNLEGKVSIPQHE